MKFTIQRLKKLDYASIHGRFHENGITRVHCRVNRLATKYETDGQTGMPRLLAL
jgi:hypothetical protein